MKVVEMVDIYPTLVDLCGFKPPADLPGASMKPLMEDPSGGSWKDKYSYTVSSSGGESIRTDKWRYNEWSRGNKGKELYDQVKDPGEFTNLTDDPKYKNVVAEMAGLMTEARKRASRIGG